MATPISAVARMMEANDVGSVIVLDDDERLAGIVTDRDLVVRAMADGRELETPVAKVMTSDVIWLRDDASLFAAASEMSTAGCRRIPILDQHSHVTGVIALDDLLTVFAQQTDKLAHVIGAEIANPNISA
jgi:signal-transduction protein with cAMP-binding, CBS, and nucleotidyltransferase domain